MRASKDSQSDFLKFDDKTDCNESVEYSQDLLISVLNSTFKSENN